MGVGGVVSSSLVTVKPEKSASVFVAVSFMLPVVLAYDSARTSSSSMSISNARSIVLSPKVADRGSGSVAMPDTLKSNGLDSRCR